MQTTRLAIPALVALAIGGRGFRVNTPHKAFLAELELASKTPGRIDHG